MYDKEFDGWGGSTGCFKLTDGLKFEMFVQWKNRILNVGE